jgi:hypothetical protein
VIDGDGVEIWMVSGVTGTVGTDILPMMDEESARHLTDVVSDLTWEISFENSLEASGPYRGPYEFSECSFGEAESCIEVSVRITDVVDIFEREICQVGWEVFALLCVDEDDSPSLVCDPVLALDQLGELFAAEDSPEMSQECQE